jgi:hypothetical protein
LVHGIFTGTDTIRPWLWWAFVSTGSTVLFLLVVRALTVGLRPERAAQTVRARSPRIAARQSRAGLANARPQHRVDVVARSPAALSESQA